MITPLSLDTGGITVSGRGVEGLVHQNPHLFVGKRDLAILWECVCACVEGIRLRDGAPTHTYTQVPTYHVRKGWMQ